ncbi:hypothetical protein QEN19_000884 [Hanseniaspora menglaensis]
MTINPYLYYNKDTKKFYCNVCEKCFTRPSFLQVHYLIHSGEKPFECKYCAKKFNVLSNLRRHEKIHTKKNCDLQQESKLKLFGFNDIKVLEEVDDKGTENDILNYKKKIPETIKKNFFSTTCNNDKVSKKEVQFYQQNSDESTISYSQNLIPHNFIVDDLAFHQRASSKHDPANHTQFSNIYSHENPHCDHVPPNAINTNNKLYYSQFTLDYLNKNFPRKIIKPLNYAAPYTLVSPFRNGHSLEQKNSTLLSKNFINSNTTNSQAYQFVKLHNSITNKSQNINVNTANQRISGNFQILSSNKKNEIKTKRGQSNKQNKSSLKAITDPFLYTSSGQ